MTRAPDTELTEAFKWRKPCYTHAGKNLVIIQPFREMCALLFFKGGRTPHFAMRSSG